MTVYRARGRPARQSSELPPDGMVTLNVDSLRQPLLAYLAQQAPNVSLAMALRDLIEMALAISPEEAAIHIERRRAHSEAQRYVYRALSQSFAQILADIENTAILLEEHNNG